MQACWTSRGICSTTRRHRVCATSRCQSTRRDPMADACCTDGSVVWTAAEDSASRRLIVQTIRQDPTGSVWTDDPSNVSRPDPSGAHQIDAQHQATDLALRPVGPTRPAGAAQELLTASACGSWPLTSRQPALGTNVDDDPESQCTVISRPSTSVTTPLRAADPTFSDSTSTRSPTSTMSTSSAIDTPGPPSLLRPPTDLKRVVAGSWWGRRPPVPVIPLVIPPGVTPPYRSTLAGRTIR